MYDAKIKKEQNDHEKHRNQLIRDMIYVCCLPDLSEKSRREFINVSVAWSFSDRSENDIEKKAKFKGCPYWSAKALKRIDDAGNWKKGGKKDKELRHEHVVPRSVFVNAMEEHFKSVRDEIEKKKDEREEILKREYEMLRAKMENCIFGCVVTKEEAKDIDKEYKTNMPEEAYQGNEKPDKDALWDLFDKIERPWKRYKMAGVKEVWKLEWKFEKGRWRTNKNDKKEVDLEQTIPKGK